MVDVERLKQEVPEVFDIEQGVSVLDTNRRQASFLAFHSHLEALSRTRSITPTDPERLLSGRGEISIAAYFDLKGQHTNPVNAAALHLLPVYDTTKHAHFVFNNKGLIDVLGIPQDPLEAARRDRGVELMVANAVDLLDPDLELVIASRAGASVYAAPDIHPDDSAHFRRLGIVAKAVAAPQNAVVVSGIAEMAAAVNEAGYADFLDYLVEVREDLGRQTEEIFLTATEST